MLTVQVREEYAAVLDSLEASVDEALREYAIRKAQARITEVEQKIQVWEDKYGCSYDLFVYRTSTDEDYVRELDANPETQQWEGDAINWEFYAAELSEWRKKLQNILTK